MLNQLTGLVDALISEPFVVCESQTRPLLGSDNQQLHLLTPLGKKRFRPYLRPRDTRDDALDFMADDEGLMWMAGIPPAATWNGCALLSLTKESGFGLVSRNCNDHFRAIPRLPQVPDPASSVRALLSKESWETTPAVGTCPA